MSRDYRDKSRPDGLLTGRYELMDDIDNTAFRLLQFMTVAELEWDMCIIMELLESAEEILKRRGYRLRGKA